MLARRKRPKLNQDAPRTDYPRHRAYVRRHVCIVPGCDGVPQFCHIRAGLPANTPSWARPGPGRKSYDAFGFPACPQHHPFDQHQHGEREFERRYGVNLLKEALDLARTSPVDEVRAFVKGLTQ